MNTAAYVVSDLHLGADPELDDFDSDAAFSDFLQKISADEHEAQVDLVLLGDIFDLWQVIPAADKTQSSAQAIDLDVEPAGEAERARRALDHHPAVAAALRCFLETVPGGRIVAVYGNHDHSLIEPAVQAVLRSAVGAPNRVVFTGKYDNPDLRVYAEHGNQYDRGNNDYANFDVLAECPGYYFVRLFWNRLEPLAPELARLYPDQWLQTFRWILQNRRWDLLTPALRYFRQYRRDKRVPQYIDVPGIPFMVAGEEIPRAGFETYPELLFRDQPPAGPNVFSQQLSTEVAYRRMYRDDEQFRERIDAYYLEHFGIRPKLDRPPAAQPGEPMPFALGKKKDPYLTAVERMFAGAENARAPYFRARPLEPAKYDYVLFGHTHNKLDQPIAGQAGKRYLNTGSWITRVDVEGNPIHIRTYARLVRDDTGAVQASLQDF